MKYFSETLNQVFNTENECLEAENKHSKALEAAEAKKKALADERATRAKEVEDAYRAAAAAKCEYDRLLREFLKDYGSFHATFKNIDPFFSIFDLF